MQCPLPQPPPDMSIVVRRCRKGSLSLRPPVDLWDFRFHIQKLSLADRREELGTISTPWIRRSLMPWLLGPLKWTATTWFGSFLRMADLWLLNLRCTWVPLFFPQKHGVLWCQKQENKLKASKLKVQRGVKILQKQEHFPVQLIYIYIYINVRWQVRIDCKI